MYNYTYTKAYDLKITSMDLFKGSSYYHHCTYWSVLMNKNTTLRKEKKYKPM